MSTAAELLSSICNRGVRLRIHCGSLHYCDQEGVMTPNEIERLRHGSRAIISELTRNLACSSSDSEVTPQSDRDTIPLTFQQEFALDYLGEMFLGIFPVRLSGALNVDALSKSVGTLIQRYEALRSRIIVTDLLPRQQVTAYDGDPLKVVGLPHSVAARTDDEVQNQIEEFINHWLAEGNTTFEARLLRITEGEHVLIILWDHLFEDYISCRIFRELWELYKSFVAGLPSPLGAKPMQYADYAVWQRLEYKAWHEKHWKYWTDRLSGASPIQLPTDNVDGGSRATLKILEVLFGESLSDALHDLARRTGVSLQLIVLTSIAIAVSRWSGQREFVIPFTFSGRYYPEHLETVGYLPNFLLLRISLADDETFAQLLECVSGEFFSAIEHLDVGKTVDGGMPELLRGPFFQWFPGSPDPGEAMMPAPSDWDEDTQKLTLAPFRIKWRAPKNTNAEFECPLTLGFWNTTRGIIGYGGYRADLFTTDTIQVFSTDLKLIAERATRDVNERIASLPSR